MKSLYEYLLMDLDGTLTDPAEGITRSVQYALRHFGIEVEDPATLHPFIGPPLDASVREFYGMSRARSLEAVAKYREYYRETGIFQNNLYPGMDDFLRRATEQGRKVVMATSKPTVFAARIARHFSIDRYFTFIAGSELDGTRSDKDKVIAYALRKLRITDTSRCVMIGDRRFDIEGARTHGMDSIAVLYGYGTPEELATAGPTRTVGTVAELGGLLL